MCICVCVCAHVCTWLILDLGGYMKGSPVNKARIYMLTDIYVQIPVVSPLTGHNIMWKHSLG